MKIKKEDFIWITSKGEALYTEDMATPHIFNALRMLWNHTVPPAFRIGKFIRRPEVNEWSREYRQDAISAFLDTLIERDDLDPEDQAELDDIVYNAEILASILLLS